MEKERGPLLTFWLFFLAFSALFNLGLYLVFGIFLKSEFLDIFYHKATASTPWIMAVLSFLQLIFLGGVFVWRKWGAYGLVLVGIGFFVAVGQFMGWFFGFMSFLSIVILLVLVYQKKEFFKKKDEGVLRGWNQKKSQNSGNLKRAAGRKSYAGSRRRAMRN